MSEEEIKILLLKQSRLSTWDLADITTDTTLDNTYQVLLCDCTSGDITLTLPAAADNVGLMYHVKKTDSSANIVTVDGNASETIDGATTQTITSQYDSIKIISDGTNWGIL